MNKPTRYLLQFAVTALLLTTPVVATVAFMPSTAEAKSVSCSGSSDASCALVCSGNACALAYGQRLLLT